MKTKVFVGYLATILALTLCTSVFAAEPEYNEGFEYIKLVPPQPTQVKEGQVEVVEVFWYGCPHCFRFEPYINKWKKTKPKNVVFIRIPASFNEGWDVHAKAFYTAQLLGVGDKIHTPLFNAIHGKGGKKLFTQDGLAEFFTKYGIKKEKFKEVYNSFQVEMRVKQADTLTRNYGVEGVPTLIINGKYRVSTSNADQNFVKMIMILNHVIGMESGNKSKKK